MATPGPSPSGCDWDDEFSREIYNIASSQKEAEDVILWANAELRIAVAGRTGAGKSTLLNTFLGVDVFVDGESFDPVTANVKEYRHEKNGVKMIVWDCPGLQDKSGLEYQYLQELKSKTKGDIHLMLYCINMLEPRSDIHVVGNAIHKLTEVLGEDIWKHVALVLTFANIFERRLTKTMQLEERKKAFADRVNEWQEKLQQTLRSKGGIKNSTIDGIKILPAGRDGHVPLCGQKNWLGDLWGEILNKVREDVRQAILKLNASRFCTPEEEGEDPDVDSHRSLPQELPTHEQPIVLTSSITGVIARGMAIGAEIGAVIGRSALSVITLGLGSDIDLGRKTGAAVGRRVGRTAAILLLMYRNRTKTKPKLG